MNNKIIILLTVIITGSMIITVNSCSTKKNTPVRRAYHNTTAKFNVYFNGYESFKAGIFKIEELPENYTRILPIYKSDLATSKNAASSDMDLAIQKAVKAIETHSITVKPERKKNTPLTKEEKEFRKKPEFCKWIDDAYLLIGKSHFYIEEYRIGLKSLQLVINKFRKEELRFDAMYWVARSYIGLKDYKEAISYLQLVKSDKKHPEHLDRPIEIAFTDIAIKQEKYEDAISKLEKIIEETKWWKRKEKARYKFILAQLYQKTGNKEKAMVQYAELIKMNPPYEMAFSAKMNMAKSFSSESGNAEELKKILFKMLKDDKNIDFKDQIYYALAEISMEEKDTLTGIDLFKASTAYSTNNSDQKALSYLALADIYFTSVPPQYMNAGSYYDSTMSVLSKNYPNYDEVSQKAENLSGLITNLKLISREDSLQKIAAMPEDRRNALIENIISNLKAKEAAEKNGPVLRNNEFGMQDFNQNQQNKGKWYFYNPTAISVGKDEFKRRWGTRKLEDHWRRKNKTSVIPEDSDETQDTTNRVSDNKKPEYYLQDLPLTDSLVEISDKKIAKAMYNVGVIYDRKMEDYSESVKSYEELIKRFPKDKMIIETYFNLYMLHYKKTKNKARAEYYRKKILKEYPYSKYAKILKNPNYLKTLEETKDKIDAIYADFYKAYKNKDYKQMSNSYQNAKKLSPDNELIPKFMFLTAISEGEQGKSKAMETLLQEVIKKYPDDQVIPRANNILEVIKSGKHDPDLFQYDEKSDYFYTIVTENDTTLLNKIKLKLTGFNVDIFPDRDMKIEKKPINDTQIQLTVKTMLGKEEAMKYFNELKSKNLYGKISTEKYRHFVITNDNFNKLQKAKFVEKYITFFDKNYLNNER